jgi:hypothetical protein
LRIAAAVPHHRKPVVIDLSGQLQVHATEYSAHLLVNMHGPCQFGDDVGKVTGLEGGVCFRGFGAGGLKGRAIRELSMSVGGRARLTCRADADTNIRAEMKSPTSAATHTPARQPRATHHRVTLPNDHMLRLLDRLDVKRQVLVDL